MRLILFIFLVVTFIVSETNAQKAGFGKGTECWSLTGDGTGPFFRSSGGNPGGYIEIVDLNDHQSWYWSAPIQFLKNKTKSIGKTMRFDIRTNYPGTSRLVRNVIIEGNGKSIGAAMPNVPQTSWTHNEIAMVASNWHYIAGDEVVSESEFYLALLNITSIRILGEYSGQIDVGGLDNFELEPFGSFTYEPKSICEPGCLNFTEQAVSNPSGYTWLFPDAQPGNATNANPANVCYPESGNYPVTLIACNNCYCDTMRQIIPVHIISESVHNVAICEGKSYRLPGGLIVHTSGIYTDTFQTTARCDSVVRTILKVKTPQTISLNLSLCFGQSFTVGDTAFATTGHFTRLLQTPEGCDSTVTLNLQINEQKTGFTSFNICKGDSVFDANTFFKTSGTVITLLKSRQTGCDSTHKTEVHVSDISLTTSPDTMVEAGTTIRLRSFSPLTTIHHEWFPAGNLQCPSCSETNATINRNTRFFIQGKDTLAGCVATDSILVTVHCPIDIPNLVTLNWDAVNDFFYLKDQLCVKKINRLVVYNRWGDLIYERKDYPEEFVQAAWQPQMPGTYFYYMDLDLYEGFNQTFKGWIEVIVP